MEVVDETTLHEVMSSGKATHEEVLEAGREAAADVQVGQHSARVETLALLMKGS